ncbi:MAG: hypothetical protein N2651_01140 [Fimbriimonadales bacterium]|nr:hypothetical protein [Fimbriimonadales bacterium]
MLYYTTETRMRWKGWLGIFVALSLISSGQTQGNVQITINYINPANTEYQMTVQNNNVGWSVDQVHVIYTTPGVLQATSTPPGWAYLPDVPWDAIPHNLRFEPTSPAQRIAPGQSRTFGFKMNTPTPSEDFYIQFRVVNASNQTKEYAYRVKILQTVDVPKDAPAASSTQIPAAGPSGPGPGGAPILYQKYGFFTPTTQYQIQTRDANNQLRDNVFYPEIPEPPHLEHYFVGEVIREVNAQGAQQNDLWTIDVVGVQWSSASMGWNELYWLYGPTQFRRPTVQWRFNPSMRLDDGSRLVRLTIRNTARTPLVGQFWMYTQGDRFLTGATLRRWRELFQPDVQRRIDLPPNGEVSVSFTLPANAPAGRFFYGEFELRQGSLPPTRTHFAHREVDSPLLIGYLGALGANRPVLVQITNPNTGLGTTKTLTADGNGVWRARLQAGDESLIDDSGFYTPAWRVRVKPRGALSRTFNEVLLPGGDTLDPYLRMNLVLGDVDGNDCIDDADLLLVLFRFGATGASPADLNLDGVVDDADLLIVLFNFGRGC